MDTSGEGKRIEYYMKKDIPIGVDLDDELKANTILGQGRADFVDAKIVAYKENDRYGDQVKVQYTIVEKDPDTSGLEIKRKIEQFIPLERKALELNNRIRTKIGLPTRSVDKDTYYSTPIFSQPPNSESGSGILD